MSSQPVPLRASEAQANRKKASRRSDVLYFVGAASVTLGASLYNIRLAFIVAGAFLLMLPMLELIGSFVKGLRAPRGR